MSLITTFRSRPQRLRAQIPVSPGLGAKALRLLPGRLFLMSLMVPQGPWLLCKCILDATFFSRYPLSLSPEQQAVDHPSGEPKWKSTDMCWHLSSVSSGTFGKHPIVPRTLSTSSCTWRTLISESSALSWSPRPKAVYRAPSTVFRTLLPRHQSLNAASPTPAWTFRCLNPYACLLDLSQESWQVWGEWLACPPRAQGGTPDHGPPTAQRPSHAISDRASRRKRWASNPN